MKRSARLLSILALTIGLCTSAAVAGTLAQSNSSAGTPAVAASTYAPALLAVAWNVETPAVKDDLSAKHGITGAAKPGVVESAVAALLIWAVALACLLLVAPQATSDSGNDKMGLPHAH